jgi:hypothetical protein
VKLIMLEWAASAIVLLAVLAFTIRYLRKPISRPASRNNFLKSGEVHAPLPHGSSGRFVLVTPTIHYHRTRAQWTNTDRRPCTAAKRGPWHVFISHAGEQKCQEVAYIREKFATWYPAVNVFVDESSLKPGDKGWDEIQIALAEALVGE